MPRHLLFLLLLGYGLLVAPPSRATPPPLLTDATVQTLAHDPQWLALLHAYPVGLTKKRWISQVVDPDFFLAENGAQDSAAELRATLNAFYQPVQQPDRHAICRYPARWFWLNRQQSLPAPALTPEQCPEFTTWLGLIRPHSLTLVFASAYLNSPSSMFGHTFLRVDPEDIASGSEWLSHAINFGAEYHPEDHSMLYAWKGLAGGYPGFFSILRYHEKINEYNRIENRDLWEYHLNLTPDEVSLLIRHLWELRNIDFDYYFFDENCSFRLLELLELARPGVKLTDSFGWRAIPLDTVRAVQAAGLVSHTRYRPATTTRLQYQINRLPADQQHLAWQLAHREHTLEDPAFTRLPADQQAGILRVAYQHLRHQQDRQTRDPALAQRSLELLQTLHRLDADEPASPPTPLAPEQGHDTLLAGIAGGHSDGRPLLDLRLRTSYHDLADNPTGYLDGAAINLGELQLRQREHDSLQIELLNLIDIDSHAPQSLFFKPITWRVQAGFDRVYSETDDTLTARVQGGAGLTRLIGQRHLLYGMGMARLEYNALLRTNTAAGAGVLAGALFYLPLGSLQLETDYYPFTDGHARADTRLIHNLPLGKNDALRLNAVHRQQLETRFDEFNLEYRHYY